MVTQPLALSMDLRWFDRLWVRISVTVSLVTALLVALTASMAAWLTDRELVVAEAEQADNLAQLFAASARDGLLIDNPELIDAGVVSLAPTVPDLVAVEVYDRDGVQVVSWHTDAPIEASVIWTPPRTVPGATPGSAVGRVRIAISDPGIDEAIEHLEWTFAAFLAIALAGCAAVALYVQRALKPIREMAEVTDLIASGDRSRTVSYTARNEVGLLARSFREMHDRIREREKRLQAKNADMRLVLDNVGQGFVTLDQQGRMAAERSAIVDRWLGPALPLQPFWQYLAPFDPHAAAWFELGWESLVESALPPDVCLAQFPRMATHGSRFLELAYVPIRQNDAMVALLIVMTDVSSEVERKRSERALQEQMHLFDQILADRAGFVAFHAEVGGLLERLQEPTLGLPELLRILHTVKGNCAVYGLDSLSTRCHELESRALETGKVTELKDRAQIRTQWQALSSRVSGLGGWSGVQITDAEYEAVITRLDEYAPRGEIAALIRGWKRERAAARLERLGLQARRIAGVLGKPEPAIVVEAGSVRLPGREWGRFWSALVHVVRNAVDHGIERPEIRTQRGKQPAGVLRLIARAGHEEVLIQIEDDGNGIDWEQVRTKARERGLPWKTQEDLVAAVFSEQFSTARTVTEISGRGLGLYAVKVECEALGGRVELRSQLGIGTEVGFVIPRTAVSPES